MSTTVRAAVTLLLVTTLSASAAPVPADSRLPVPDPAAQAKAEKLIRDVFGNYAQTARADRPAIASKMIVQAASSEDEPAARYVLLRRAAELAASVGDATTAARAAGEIAAAFSVDPDEFRTEMLRKSAAVPGPDSARNTVAAALESADSALKSDRFEPAVRYAALAETTAQSARDPALVAAATARASAIRWTGKEQPRAKAAEDKLAKDPADPDANTTLGRFLCLGKEDWSRGLPYLAKSATPALRVAAAADLDNPTTLDAQLAVADAWWDAADNETALQQPAVRRRAAEWYAKAVADDQLTGLLRARAEKRIAEVATGRVVADADRTRTVVLLRAKQEEEPIFKRVAAGGKLKIIPATDHADALADPDTYKNVDVLVCGVNRLRDLPAKTPDERAQDMIGHFVQQGGDLIVFEQFTASNTKCLERLFGVQVHGANINGAIVAQPELRAKIQSAGLIKSLASVHFYNAYRNLPEKSVILLRGDDAEALPTAAIVPVGKGRLILFGTAIDPTDRPLDIATLEFIYRLAPDRK